MPLQERIKRAFNLPRHDRRPSPSPERTTDGSDALENSTSPVHTPSVGPKAHARHRAPAIHTYRIRGVLDTITATDIEQICHIGKDRFSLAKTDSHEAATQTLVATFQDGNIPSFVTSLPHKMRGKAVLVDEDFLGLTVLCSGEEDNVDVVAVHGLDGHAFKAWACDGTMWLRDFLPAQLPKARIMTFGYDSKLIGSASAATIRDFAPGLLSSLDVQRTEQEKERPIIFVCHSLGGIVVKQALNLARIEGRSRIINDATYGIVFLATPHRGSETAEYGTLLGKVAKTVNLREDLVRDLQAKSGRLQEIAEEFREHHNSLRLGTFFETRRTVVKIGGVTILNEVVVDKKSAVLNLAHEEQTPLDKDHSEICKFEHEEEDAYKAVYRTIKKFAADAPTEIKTRLHQKGLTQISYRVPTTLPFLRNSNFTGRDEELKKMHEILYENTSKEQKRIVLYGLGGIGKSQLAVEYAYAHDHLYTSIWWVNVANSATFALSTTSIVQSLIKHYGSDPGSYTRAAQLLGIPDRLVDHNTGRLSTAEIDNKEVVEAIKRWLARDGNNNWLLILDNADDLGAVDVNGGPLTIIPSISHGAIVITTRRPDYKRIGKPLEIEEMSQEESLDLLYKSIGPDAKDTTDKTEAERLVKKLGHLPLAIDQAGSFISARQWQIQRYLDVFDDNFRTIFSEKPDISSYEDKTLYTTWKISFDAVKNKDSQAAELFLLCSFFSNDDIPDEMLRRGLGLTKSDLTLDNQLQLIFSYSLAKRKGSPESFYIHTMVQHWTQDHLDMQDHSRKIKDAFGLMSKAIPFKGDRKADQRQFERQIMAHVRTLCNNFGKKPHPDADYHDVHFVASLLSIVYTCYDQGWQKEAEKLGVQVREMNKRVLGQEHPLTLASMHTLASIYWSQGRWKEAEELGVQVMEMRKKVLGQEHPDTLDSMYNLASTYRSQRRWKEAEELEVKVMEMKKKVLGQEHPDTLSSMHNLALIYSNQGRWKEAEELGVKIMKVKKKVLGQEHPDTLSSMHNLALIYCSQGWLKKAEELGVQVMEMKKKVLGQEHPDTLDSMYNLISIYWNQGRWKEAEELGVQVMEMNKKVLGQEHPDTLASMHNLACTYMDLDRIDAAITLMTRVVSLRSKKLGEGHPRTISSKNALDAWVHGTRGGQIE